MNTKDDDPVRHILVGDTHDTLLFFTNTGRVLRLTSYELRADTSRNTRGVPVVNVVALKDREKVSAIVGASNLSDKDLFLVLTTSTGRIKRVALEEYKNINRAGLITMILKNNENLVIEPY